MDQRDGAASRQSEIETLAQVDGSRLAMSMLLNEAPQLVIGRQLVAVQDRKSLARSGVLPLHDASSSRGSAAPR
jgi:hypothetical protein